MHAHHRRVHEPRERRQRQLARGGRRRLRPRRGPATGARDIVWRNDTSGKFVVWHMDGGFPTATRLSGVFTNPDSPANALAWRIVAPR